jgi:hypothetical protein
LDWTSENSPQAGNAAAAMQSPPNARKDESHASPTVLAAAALLADGVMLGIYHARKRRASGGSPVNPFSESPVTD